MSSWDDKPDPNTEITDLETARLALRGALQSARNLQDLNSGLKGQLQDFLHREKALNERMIVLQKELNECYRRLDEQAALGSERNADEREALRKEIASEQNQKLQAEMNALAQSVENWAEIRREKETELSHLKAALLQKEAEVFTLQKEKISQEEKSHRDMLDVMAKSRTSIYDAVESAVKPKEAEIAAFKIKIDEQEKETVARVEAMAGEVRSQEQDMLEEFRKRQQALEVEHTKRERELWEHTQTMRASLEEQLKNAWGERLKTVEHDYNARRGVLESDWRQKEKELNERWLLREADLHRQWTDKETAIARDWMAREKSLLEEFQSKLDEERLRGSTEISDIKSKSEVWRTSLEQELHRKEMEFNRRHQDAQEGLRATWRRREEELLAKHQEISEKAQKALAEIQSRYVEKDNAFHALQEKIVVAEKEKSVLAMRLEQVQRDAGARSASLEEQVRLRDQELENKVGQFTARDEERLGRLSAFQREVAQRESDVKVLQTRVLQIEADRDAAIAQAIALQADFDKRHQELEESARHEIRQLRTQLTTLAQGSTEREQDYQRRLVECETLLVQRDSQVKGMDEQLALARKAVQDLTDRITAQDADFAHRNTALQDRLVERETELVQEIQKLRSDRDHREENLRHQLIGLQNDLAERLRESKILEDHFNKTEARREDAETRLEALQQQIHVLRKESEDAATLQKRESTETLQQQAQIRAAFERRILELESEIRRRAEDVIQLQDRLAQQAKDRETDQQTSTVREGRLQEKAIFLEAALKDQDLQWNTRLTTFERDHLQIEADMQRRLLDFDADMARRAQQAEELTQRLQTSQSSGEALDQKVDYLERALAEQERQSEAQRQVLLVQLNDYSRASETAKESLAQQIRVLEVDLRERESLIATLRDEKLQSQKELEALAEATAWTEKGLLEKVQFVERRMVLEQKEYNDLLSAARQQHTETSETAQRRIADLESTLQHTASELALAQEALTLTRKENASIVAETATRDAALTERIQSLEERLRTQKEQMTAKVASVDRERLLNEEALHTKMLDLEQRVVQKTGTAKMLQDRLTRTEDERATLEKKVTNLENHVNRVEQQLKNKEVEYVAAMTTAQKENTTTHEADQRRVLDLQNTKLTLESELATLRESLATAGSDRQRLETKIRDLQTAMATAQAESLKQHDAQRTRLLKLESDLTANDSLVKGLQEAIVIRDSEKAEILQSAQSEKAKALAETQRLEKAAKAQELEFENRWTALLQERSATDLALADKIRHLQDDQRSKETALQSLTGQLHQANEVRLRLEAQRDQQSKEAGLQRQDLEARWQAEQERVRDLNAQVVTYAAQLKALEAALSTARVEAETLAQALENQRATFAQELQTVQATEKDRQELLQRQLTALDSDLRAQLKHQSDEATAKIDQLQLRGRELEKELATRARALQDLQAQSQSLTEDRERLLIIQDQQTQERVRFEALEIQNAQTQAALNTQLLDLKNQLAARDVDLKTMQQRVEHVEATRQGMDKDFSKKTTDWSTQRDVLQSRLMAERDHVYQLEQTLAAKVAEYKELESTWVSAQQDQEKVRDARVVDHQHIDEMQKHLAKLQSELSDRDRYIGRLRHDIAKHEEEQSAMQSQIDAQMQAHQAQADTISSERVAWAQEKELLQDAMREQNADFDKRLHAVQVDRGQAEEALHLRIVGIQDQLSRRETELKSVQLHEVAELKSALDTVRQEREALLLRIAQEQEDSQTKLRAQDTKNAESLLAAHLRMKEMEKELRDRLAGASVDAANRLAVLQKRVLDLERQVSEREGSIKDLEESLTSTVQMRDRLEALLASLDQDHKTASGEWAKERNTFTQRVSALEQTLMAQRQEWDGKMVEIRESHRLAEQNLVQRQSVLQSELDRRLNALHTVEDALKRAETAHASSRASSEQHSAQWANERAVLDSQLSEERLHLNELQSAFSIQASQVAELRDEVSAADQDRQRLKSALSGQQEKYLAQVKRYEEGTVQREADWQEAIDALDAEWRERIDGAAKESQERAEGLQVRSAELERELGLRDAQLRRLEDDVHALQEQDRRQEAVLAAREAALQETAAQRDGLASRIQDMEKSFTAQRSNWDRQIEQLREERRTTEHGLRERQVVLEADLKEKLDIVRTLSESLQRAEAAHQLAEITLKDSTSQWSEERSALDTGLTQERERLGALQSALALQATEVKELRDLLSVADQDRQRLKAALSGQQEKYLAHVSGIEQKGAHREAEWKATFDHLDAQWRQRVDAADAEAKKRADLLHGRSSDLEEALGSRETQIHHLQDLLNALQEKDRRQQGVISSREAALKETAAQRDELAAQVQAVQQSAEAQRADWERQAEGLRDERRSIEHQLKERQMSLEADLKEKIDTVKQLSESLQRAEEMHLVLETSSAESVAQWNQERSALDASLTEERERLGQLQGTLALQATEVKELRDLLSVADQDRQRVKAALSDQQEKYLAQLSRVEEKGVLRDVEWKTALDTLDAQWRHRVEASSGEAKKRADVLHARSTDLEQALGSRDTQIHHLQDQLNALQEQERRQKAVLTSREAALKETATQRDQLAAQIQMVQQSAEAQRAEWERQVEALRDERRTIEHQLKERQMNLEADLKEKIDGVKLLSESLARAEEAHHLLETSSSETAAQWNRERTALDASLKTERERLGQLQGSLALQATEVKELRDLLSVADQDRQRVKAALAEQQDKYVAQLAAVENKNGQREMEWKAALDSLDGQWRQRIDLSTVEAKKRADALQRRSSELEQALGARDTQIHRLEDQLSALQEQDQRQQAVLQSREVALKETAAQRDQLAARLLVMDQGFAAQRGEWERKTLALRDEHRAIQEKLQERHDSLRVELDHRITDLTSTEEALKHSESAHQSAVAAASVAASQGAQERQALEKSLNAERLRLRDLQGVASAQALQVQELKGLMAAADQDRVRLKAALTEQQQKYLSQVASHEEATFHLQTDWKMTVEQLETEWRTRVETVSADSEKRAEALQVRADELESQLGIIDAERRQLQDDLHALQEQKHRQVTIHAAREKSLQDTAAQRDHLAERLQTMEHAFAAQRIEWEKTISALREDHQSSESDLQKRQSALKIDLEKKEHALRALEKALERAEAAHAATRSTTEATSSQWANERQALEESLRHERVRLAELQSALGNQTSAVKELRDLLASSDQDRRHLQMSLSAQQEKAVAQAAQLEQKSRLQETDWKETVDRLETQWRQQLDTTTAEAQARVEALQVRSTELEQLLGARDAAMHRLEDQVHTLQEQDRRQQVVQTAREKAFQDLTAERNRLHEQTEAMSHAFTTQRGDWEKKVLSLRDEHHATQEALQERHDALRAELDRRVNELQQTENALHQAEADHLASASVSDTSAAQWAKDRDALEKNLGAERLRLRDLQGVSAVQTSQILELQGLMAAADQDRQRLKTALAEQQEKYLAQVARYEEFTFRREGDWKGTLEQLETEWRTRVESMTAESQKRVEALQARAAELEVQLGTVDAERRQLEDNVHALQEQDRRQEVMDSAREKALQELSVERDQLVERLQSMEQGFAGQRAEWDRAQAAAQEAQRVAEQQLQKRLAAIQRDLSVKSADLQSMENALAQARTASSAIEWSAKEASGKWEQERAQFDARLMQERQALARTQGELEDQLAQMKELQQTISVANADRERLKKALTAQQDKYLARVAQDEGTLAQQVAESKKAVEALNLEWRHRLEMLETEMHQRTGQLQSQTVELEKEVEVRHSDLQALRLALATSDAERNRLSRLAEERQSIIAKLQEKETLLLQQLDSVSRRARTLSEDVQSRTQAVVALEKRLAEDEKTRVRLQTALSEHSKESAQAQSDFEQRLAADRQLLQELERRQTQHLQDMNTLRHEVSALSEERAALMDRMGEQTEHFQSELAKRDGEAITHEAAFRVEMETAEREAQDRMSRWITESDQRVSALQARRQDLERLLGEKEIELRTLHDRFEKIDEERQRLLTLDSAREKTLQELKAREREGLRQQELLDRRLQELEGLTASQSQQVSQLKAQLLESDRRLRETETLSSKSEQGRGVLELQLAVSQREVADLQRLTAAFEDERKTLIDQLAEQRTLLLREGVERHAVQESGQRQWNDRLAALDQEWRERAERTSREGAERVTALQKRLIDLEHELDEKVTASQALAEQVSMVSAEAARGKALLSERDQSLDQLKKTERQAQKRSEEAQRRLVDLEAERTAQDHLLSELRVQLEKLERSAQASGHAASQERERLEKDVLRHAESERTLQERLDRVFQEMALRSTEAQRLEEQLTALKASREELEKSASKHLTLAQAKGEFEERWLKEKRHAHEFQEQLAAQSVKLKDLQESLALATQKWKSDQESLELQKSKFTEQMDQLRRHASEQHSTFSRTIQDLEEQLATLQTTKLDNEQALEKRCVTLQDQLAQNTARMRSLETQLQDSERDRQVWDKTLSEGQSSLDQERRHWQTRLTEERQRATQLERELSIQRAKLLDVQQNGSKAETERQALEEMLQGLKDRLASADHQSTEQIDSLQQRSSELELQSAEQQGEIQAREKQIVELQSELHRLESLLNDKKGNLSKHRQALEAEFKQRVQNLERKAKEEEASRRRDWERRERETREQHTAEMEKAQASFLAQVQALRDESEQTLSRLQNDQQADDTRRETGRLEHRDLQGQLESARAQLDQQKRDLTEQRKTLDERAQRLSEREQGLHEARAGAEELRDKMVTELQTGNGRANTSVMQSLLEEWVFGFAHQVRNPMGIIRSIAETMLQAARAKSPERNSLQAILKAVDGLNHRLSEFIEFSKPVRPVTKSLLLPQSWDRVTAALKDRLERQQVKIETRWPDPMPLLLVDPEHLHTILMHLTSNALDALPVGGSMVLSAQYDRRSHLLQIRLVDHGAGIRPEHMKEVGKPFFTTKTAAVGLGLALTKRLLRAYEGELKIEPASPQGTSVTIKLYAQEGEATAWAA